MVPHGPAAGANPKTLRASSGKRPADDLDRLLDPADDQHNLLARDPDGRGLSAPAPPWNFPRRPTQAPGVSIEHRSIRDRGRVQPHPAPALMNKTCGPAPSAAPPSRAQISG